MHAEGRNRVNALMHASLTLRRMRRQTLHAALEFEINSLLATSASVGKQTVQRKQSVFGEEGAAAAEKMKG